MNKILFILIVVINVFSIQGQTIKGEVVDVKTEEPIPFANIYINGSSMGTMSDNEGYFEITKENFQSKIITVSAIGYYSKDFRLVGNPDDLYVKLESKSYGIDEAVVTSESLVRKRKKYLRIFKKQLFGFTENASYCKILNEEDISFNYFEHPDTIKAFASKPIIIENKALGYVMHFYMDGFAYYNNSGFTYFDGNFKFMEDSVKENEFVKESREYSYNGSRMHFFRSLWENKLAENHYDIIDKNGKSLKYSQIVLEDPYGNKYLSYDGEIKIYFYRYETRIVLRKNLVYFDKNGAFDPTGIRWDGFFANKRVADRLPLEYYPEINNEN